MLQSSNVRLAITGSVAIAPVGTDFPRDAVTPLPSGWLDLGYISDAGVKEVVSGDPTTIVPWRSSRVARTSPGQVAVEYSFAMLETNVEALGLFYGTVLAEGDVWHHVMAPGQGGPMSVVLTMVDGCFVTRRWLPHADSSESGERQFSALAPGEMGVTLVAYPSADLMGDGVNSQAVAFYSAGLPSAGPPDEHYRAPELSAFSDDFDEAFVWPPYGRPPPPRPGC